MNNFDELEGKDFLAAMKDDPEGFKAWQEARHVEWQRELDRKLRAVEYKFRLLREQRARQRKQRHAQEPGDCLFIVDEDYWRGLTALDRASDDW